MLNKNHFLCLLLLASGPVLKAADIGPSLTPPRTGFEVAATSPIPVPSGSNDLNFQATLNGAQETPPVQTPATGDFVIHYDSTNDTVAYTLSYSGLSNVVAAHIHVGAEGQAGPIIFVLSDKTFSSPLASTLKEQDFTPAPQAGINTLDDAAKALLQGNTYVNIHTSQNPGGEIRGQIKVQPHT